MKLLYFAKYLPVEGGYRRTVKSEEGIPIDFEQEVKLFLCSRDIQVGDTVYWADSDKDDTHDYSGEYTVTVVDETIMIKNSKGLIEVTSDEIFKVIGEISPNATWVKDGDEFDEDEVSISRHFRLDSGKLSRKLRKTDVHTNEVKLCKIKCPCGHFH